MDSNRSEILAQLASGQITADQAAEQLRGPSTCTRPLSDTHCPELVAAKQSLARASVAQPRDTP